MKYILLLCLICPLLFSSCKKGCQDCGPETIDEFYVVNGLTQDMDVRFYGTDTEKKVQLQDSHLIKAQDRFRLMKVYTSTLDERSSLSFNYALVDSVDFLVGGHLHHRLTTPNRCTEVQDILCRANYVKTGSRKVSSGKFKGDEYVTWEHVVK